MLPYLHLQRNYLKLLILFLLLTAAVIVALYYNSSNTLLNSHTLTNNRALKDSIHVIRLNKEAFDYRLTNPKNTVSIADSALHLAMQINYVRGVAEAYRVRGLGFAYLENHALATKNYNDALQYFKQLGDHKNVARTYSNIGILYKYNDPDKALQHFKAALRIARRIKDEELIGGIHFNIALAHFKKSDYTSSLASFNKSYKIFEKRNDTVSMIIYLQNTGRVYHRLNKMDLAKERLIEAIRRAKKLKLYNTLSNCYLALFYIHLDENQFKLAEAAIAEGLGYSQMVMNPVTKNDFVRGRYELELRRKNYKEALKYLSLVYHNDSLLLNENLSSNIDFHSKHYLQVQKIRENELIIARQKYQQASSRWMFFLTVSVFLLAVITALIYHFWKERRRKRKEISDQSKITLLEHKALQAMMNPHFVFNVMNSIQHFINQADAKSANQVLSGFAKLARKHLEICMNSTISVQKELVYLDLYLSLEKVRFIDKMDYSITVDESMDPDEIIIPSMLIQPFLENAIWHGIMPKEGGGVIKLDLTLKCSDLVITIVDDGIGIYNSETLPKSGHISRGMALIRERVSLLNKLNKRQIFIEQRQMGDVGTLVMIKIPI
ncbi:MAG: tetratricopeptide repeat protein [Daejeonella sp.]|uniref:tetratricopeptide repeat-containing sensor histidine kinase n=1 Tax=Daejeonella sp. TaxID=2805397 RepID=UPI003C75662C